VLISAVSVDSGVSPPPFTWSAWMALRMAALSFVKPRKAR
jgi:hypothetical protein